MTAVEIREALTDRTAMAATIWGEARGEPLTGQVAVAWVIRHRMFDDRWPDSAKAVCLQPLQFSCWLPDGGNTNYHRTIAAAERLVSEVPFDDDDDRKLAQALWITDGVLRGVCEDVTRGATNYHVASMDPWPSWSRGQVPVIAHGDHVFFRL